MSSASLKTFVVYRIVHVVVFAVCLFPSIAHMSTYSQRYTSNLFLMDTENVEWLNVFIREVPKRMD